MKSASRSLAIFVSLGTIFSGCKSSDSSGEREAGEAPKRPPKVATMYVESKGEPLNAGGKKVEKSDETGEAKGGFSPKDLLMPGMFVLVSGATAVGGPLLIKALDRKDRPSGAITVAGGGTDGTFVPVETSGAAGSAVDPGGSAGSTPAAPDPSGVSAVSKSSPSSDAPTLAAGHGVVSTPSSVLLSMGYASDFSGPSYITGKLGYSRTEELPWTEVHVYSWELTVDRTASERGGRVDVFATFTGLSKGDVVCLYLYVSGKATFTCDHTPQVPRMPPGGLKDEWVSTKVPLSPGSDTLVGPDPPTYILMFRLPVAGKPIKLGTLTLEGETDIVGSSTAEVTVH